MHFENCEAPPPQKQSPGHLLFHHKKLQLPHQAQNWEEEVTPGPLPSPRLALWPELSLLLPPWPGMVPSLL